MIAGLLEEYLRDEFNLRKNRVSSEKFLVSDAGRCRLMRYWKRQGKETSIVYDSRMLRVFKAGSIFHEWVDDILNKKGSLFVKRIRINDEHRSGEVDNIIYEDGKKILYEFKSVHSKKFSYLAERGMDLHHACQVVTYRHMLPFEVDDARVCYISKDDLRVHEDSVYKVYPNIDLTVETDWYVLIEDWKAGREPEPNPENWECAYCDYRDTCQYILIKEPKEKKTKKSKEKK